MKKRILITGGTGRFGTVLKKIKTNYEMFFPNKKILDITKFRSIQKYIKFKKRMDNGIQNIACIFTIISFISMELNA